MSDKTDDLLVTRGTTHGEFRSNARTEQEMVAVFESGDQWPSMQPMQRVALRMIAHKISRAINGDPYFAEHWDDMAGYARLVSQRLASGELVRTSEALTSADSALQRLLADHGLTLVVSMNGEMSLLHGPTPAQEAMAREMMTRETGGRARPRAWTPPAEPSGGSAEPAQPAPGTTVAPAPPAVVASPLAVGDRVWVHRLAAGGRLVSGPSSTKRWLINFVEGVEGVWVDEEDITRIGNRDRIADAGGPIILSDIPEEEPRMPSEEERQPIDATYAEWREILGRRIWHGSLRGQLWGDLYVAGPDGRHRMGLAYQAEYGR